MEEGSVFIVLKYCAGSRDKYIMLGPWPACENDSKTLVL
jgi:hypothetical protein